MKTITAIEQQKKNNKRCNIYLDGQFFCGMQLETVMKARLKEGMTVSESEIASVQLASEKAVALDTALVYLTASSKTTKQIRDYLKKKGYTYLVIDSVVEKLKEYKYLDDEEYARTYSELYGNSRGARKIRQDLQLKGVSRDICDKTVAEIGDQTDAAFTILSKYLKNKEIDVKTVQKAYRHLLSRGFSYDDARNALGRFKDIEQFDEDN